LPRIAVIQTEGTRLSDWSRTIQPVRDAVHAAAQHGAELALLPECVWPAYCIGSRAEYFAARAAGLPSDREFLDKLCDWARRAGIWVCAGLVSERGDALANSAVLVDAAGEVRHRYDKCFLWDFDNDWFEPGASLECVDTPFGRLGIMICADARLPEISATLTAGGAQLLLQPTAWVNAAGVDAPLWNPQADFLIRARAREFGIPIASASKWGVEGGTTFVGSSLVCGAGGAVLTQAAKDRSEMLIADVTPSEPRPVHVTERRRDMLARRGYGEIVCDNDRQLELAFDAGHGTRDHADLGGSVTRVALALEARNGHSPNLRATCGARELAPSEDPYDLSGVRVAVMTPAEVESFVAPRCAALAGALLVIVCGEAAGFTVRARALENRVFVAGVCEGRTILVGPDGRVRHRLLGPGDCCRIHPSEAACKEVARRSDVLRARRPGMYAFG